MMEHHGRRPSWIARALPLLRVLSRYFRAEVRGLHRIPAGPALLVANHSGGMGSPDFVFAARYLSGAGAGEPLYVLVHGLFTRAPGLGPLLGRFGLVPATAANAVGVLRRGGKVLIYPGADFDSLRPFRSRKRVCLGGRHGFVTLARRTGAPIVPVVTAGSHETFLVLAQGTRLARWLRLERWLGLHTVPVIFCLPWMLVVGPLSLVPYWPLPAKVTVEVGDPIRLEPRRGTDGIQGDYRRVVGVMQSILDRLYAERRLPVWG